MRFCLGSSLNHFNLPAPVEVSIADAILFGFKLHPQPAAQGFERVSIADAILFGFKLAAGHGHDAQIIGSFNR